MQKLQLFLLISCIASIAAGIYVNTVFGFFHDPKPSILINPDVQAAYDELYSHHPNIEQYHIDTAYNKLVNDCVEHVNTENNARGDGNNPMAKFVCTAANSGMLKNYLEDLGGYTFVDPTPYMQAPQLIK